MQVTDEVKYIKSLKTDRSRQLHELRIRIDENASTDSSQRNAFEQEMKSSLNTILATDYSRRASFQLSHDEEQQIVAVSIWSFVNLYGLMLLYTSFSWFVAMLLLGEFLHQQLRIIITAATGKMDTHVSQSD